MQLSKEFAIIGGKTIPVYSLLVDNKYFVVTGNQLKTAMLREEWYEDVANPESVIQAFKIAAPKPDLFTFWQRPPESKPKYDYYMEPVTISLLPIRSFDYWWEKQVPYDVRKNVKKSARRGVDVRVVDFNDDLVRGIMDIFNETPVKRGKPFRHYGKDFETVKREISQHLDKSIFIGAYHIEELIGFYKLHFTENFAQPVVSISKIKHRDKKTDDALMAKSVDICEKKGIPYFTYGEWRRGSHADFLVRRGFERMRLPRYYVPLTLKGRLILALKLHHGIAGLIPEKIKTRLIDVRAKWYENKYNGKLERTYIE